MRITAGAVIATSGGLAMIGSALAADMTGAEIKASIAGKSVYLETTGASAAGRAGQAVIYYGEDGTAFYRTPMGAVWHGTWQIKGDTVCIDWKEKPNNPCTRWDKAGGTLSIIRATTGETIAKVDKIAAGNAEKLAP